ncbi:hypothetical protein [Pseudomonas coronafaciens]|uniref:hypothetical protein n=1 Tax=Pseudomonas coronafaciens TaxID=53409 RepID=UPI000A7C8975|nr:hypothetical protein [Pseudomonas coronafaciens]
MLSQMPVGLNKSNLIHYLERYFLGFYCPGNKGYYCCMVKTEIGYSYLEGWQPAAALYEAFAFVCNRDCFVWAVQRNAINVVDLMDWAVSNMDRGFTRSHVEFIESSVEREGAMESRHLVTSVVSYMNSDSAFDPPYTDMHRTNFNMLYV